MIYFIMYIIVSYILLAIFKFEDSKGRETAYWFDIILVILFFWAYIPIKLVEKYNNIRDKQEEKKKGNK